MATYNKPGVYVEETQITNQQVASGAATSTAAFIGVADRGPTTVDGSGNVLGVPTLVTSWTDFVDQFSFNSVVTPWTSTVNANSVDLKYAVKSFFENGGSQAYIQRIVNTDAAKASASFVNGTTAALTVTAKSHGAWGNNVWVAATANTVTGYFDLYVYYSETATSAAAISYAGNHVEHFTQLTMTPGPRYAVNAVQSNYISVEKPAANTSNLNPTTSTTPTQLSGGSRGAITPTTAQVLNQLDPVSGPLVINWPKSAVYVNHDVTNKAVAWSSGSTGTATLTVGAHSYLAGDSVTVAGVGAPFNGTFTLSAVASTTVSYVVAATQATASTTASGKIVGPRDYTIDQTTIANAQFDYASGRSDAFVVLDAADAPVATVTTTASTSTYNTTGNYAALYYPYFYIPDPTSRVGGTKKIAPGGAVTAMYVKADAQKGPFQSPAGLGTKIVNAVSVGALSNSDFNLIANNQLPVNVIRFVPGTGICVMGARTLSQGTTDNYVSVRRSLIYLEKSLMNLTQFAVFEPNDTVLQSRVRTVVDSFLYGYWRKGGLKGASSAEAYYVVCDSTNNNQATVDAGELHIEVGVALQKPAEFVIIKIGQLDGGTTVTVQG